MWSYCAQPSRHFLKLVIIKAVENRWSWLNLWDHESWSWLNLYRDHECFEIKHLIYSNLSRITFSGLHRLLSCSCYSTHPLRFYYFPLKEQKSKTIKSIKMMKRRNFFARFNYLELNKEGTRTRHNNLNSLQFLFHDQWWREEKFDQI